MAILLQVPQPPITKTNLIIIYVDFNSNLPGANELIHKKLEMHRCILSTVATDALMLKHQATGILTEGLL